MDCNERLLRTLNRLHGSGWFNERDILLTGGWWDTVSVAQPGDLVYLDSPYPETFGYGTGWTLYDWSQMYLWVERAIGLGIHILVSNPGTLRLLWEKLLPIGELHHTPNQGRKSANRDEYLGYHGPTEIQKPLNIRDLFR